MLPTISSEIPTCVCISERYHLGLAHEPFSEAQVRARKVLISTNWLCPCLGWELGDWSLEQEGSGTALWLEARSLTSKCLWGELLLCCFILTWVRNNCLLTSLMSVAGLAQFSGLLLLLPQSNLVKYHMPSNEAFATSRSLHNGKLHPCWQETYPVSTTYNVWTTSFIFPSKWNAKASVP